MNKNYTPYHVHTDLSNGTTTLDSVNKIQHYIDMAKSLNMTAFAFSEHGNVFEWLHKKEAIEKAGMKYIHGMEAYVTETTDEKERDNYHVGLYARNYQGVLEINKLSSISFGRNDGHMYYSPRITINELINTSNNVIITTACLGGILFSDNDNIKNVFIKFLSENKHRCFLEIQHHNVHEQKEYNKYLLNLSNLIEVPLIAGTDTHALDNEYMIGRKILQARKGIRFDNEDDWDLTFKSYDELVDSYKEQNSLPIEVVLDAIENTNVLASMVEEFELDRSFKYPKLYKDSMGVINKKLADGYSRRNINKKQNVGVYNKQIRYELEVYNKQKAIDFLLLEENIKSAMRSEGRFCGYSRGSVSGSEIAYLLGITEVDSIKYNLYFERFMNTERISLADVDTDWSPYDRDRVKEYIHEDMKKSFSGLYTSEIITFNTIALKGAFKDVVGGIKDLVESGRMDFDEVITLEQANEITKDIDEREGFYRSKYPKTFKYVDMLMGVIVSVGTHPSATIVSPVDLDDSIGTFTLSTNKYPVSQLNMKEVDSLNYVKLDILGLDNVGIINRACELAGIDVLTPDNMDFSDDNVWDNICKHPLGIFQFESDFAFSTLKKILSEDTMAKIKEVFPDAKKLSLMSMANGAIRPAGESYRDALVSGEFKDNGHKALNDALGYTNGYLVYQEQLLEFLNKFCGYTLGQADIVRRGFAKKTGTEKFIPQIKSGFIKTMSDKYGLSNDESEKIIVDFLRIIEDASDYLFSLNHSDPYSMIGFATGYLRTYYPIEFLTSVLEMNENNLIKTSKALEYMTQYTDIKIEPAKFRYSTGRYMPNKLTNTIYKGVGSIKNLNSEIGDKLYELKDNEYSSFYDFLEQVNFLNKTQMETLIKIDYFREFGKSKKLMDFYTIHRDWADKKTIKKDKLEESPFSLEVIQQNSHETEKQFSKINFKPILEDLFNKMEDVDYTIAEKIGFQDELLGYVAISVDTDPKNCYVLDVIKNAKFKKSHPKLMLMSLGSGKTFDAKIDSKYFDIIDIKKGDLISIHQSKHKPIQFKNDETGEWETVPNKRQYWVLNVSKITDDDL